LCLEVLRKTCISVLYVHSRETLCLQVQQLMKCTAEHFTVLVLCTVLYNIALCLLQTHEASHNHRASTLPDTAVDNPAFCLPSRPVTGYLARNLEKKGCEGVGGREETLYENFSARLWTIFPAFFSSSRSGFDSRSDENFCENVGTIYT